jgi:hypothetical protein
LAFGALNLCKEVGWCCMGDASACNPVREADMDAMYDAHVEIANRGRFFPRGVLSRRGSLQASLLRSDARPWER